MMEYNKKVYFISFENVEGINFSISQNSYHPVVDVAIRDKIVDRYMEFFNISIHNGFSANMDSIFIDKSIILKVSSIEFFEVFLFNNFRKLDDSFINYLKRNSDYDILKYYYNIVENYNVMIDSNKNINLFLQNASMPKPLAISVMVRTVDNKYLITKRPMSLAVGAGLSSVSVTGAIEMDDFNSPNPFIECANRELYEELNIKVSPENINILGMGVGKIKMQPVIIMNVDTELTSTEVLNKSSNAKEYSLEVSEIQAVDIIDLKKLYEKNNFTEIGGFHIETILQKI